jgi:hypothetical protein
MTKRLGADLCVGLDNAAKVVEELQLAQGSALDKLRSVMPVQASVVARPADSIQRDTSAVTGTTRELRPTSVVAVLSRPAAVGSFFELSFDAGDLDLPPTFGRCDRCTILDELEFETRFQFLQPIVMPGTGGPMAAK